jgi:DNA polymerase-3 subunit epsilon
VTYQWPNLSADGKTITIHRLEVEAMFKFPAYATAEWISLNADLIRNGAVLDVETTGLSHDESHIIELGVRQFQFNRLTGEILNLGPSYSGFQDPGEPILPEITDLTGITDEMVKGKSIDWQAVESIIESSHIMIAHNASFDRPFIDARSTHSSERVWACSVNQIDWNGKGLPSKKLEVLSFYHGFFNDAHRALNDADSLLYLLSKVDQAVGAPYLLELINEARKSLVIVYATYAPFEVKDALRERRYRWSAPEKVWSRKISKEQLNEELEWLSSEVYHGPFRGKTVEILPKDQFKLRS